MKRADTFKSERHCALDAVYPAAPCHPREVPQDLPYTRRNFAYAVLIVLVTVAASALFDYLGALQ